MEGAFRKMILLLPRRPVPRYTPSMDALSPLDGRYASKVDSLRPYFSEAALMRSRVFIEISYFSALAADKTITELPALTDRQEKALAKIIDTFGAKQAAAIAAIEKTTNHDVKAVEYYLRETFKKSKDLKGLKRSFLHFGLTSEDVNNLAYGILMHAALEDVLLPSLLSIITTLHTMGESLRGEKMLSLTHGQPATPTTLGKELLVFAERLERQYMALTNWRMQGKFGGAVGTYAAHKAAYPDVKWEKFGEKFLHSLGLVPLKNTTQINPHDDLAELSHFFIRINTILLDFSRDIWAYISRGVFTQKTKKGEVGSSTMPHKVNPIDFENAEGNLGIATALFSHFAQKLPVSRLQRDLSDSTVQRNIGVAFGHHLLALSSLQKGLGKLSVDTKTLARERAEHPEVQAEAIQTVMRRYGHEDAYEQMKSLTRGEKVTEKDLEAFIKKLKIPEKEKKRLMASLQRT